MSKILNGIFLVVVAGVAAAPYFVGMQVESQYHDSLAQLNKNYAGQMTVKGTYKRGYFTSHANTEISFANGSTPLKLEHTIFNGPVILDFKSPTDFKSYIPHGIKFATVDTVIDAGDFNAVLKNVYKDKPAYTLTTEFMFDGSGSTTLINFPFSMPLGQGEINWKGLSLTVFHTKNFTSTNSLFSTPGLSYTEMTADMAKKNEFRIADIKANYSSTGVNAENLDLTIDAIALIEDSKTIFNADRLKIKGDYVRNNKLIKSDVTYAFNKMQFASDEYGPMQLTLKFNNLDVDLVDQLTANIGTTLGSSGVPRPADMLTSVHTYLTPEQLKAALVAMPNADVDWSLTTPKGKVTVKGDMTMGSKTLTAVDFASVFPTVTAKGSAKIDQGLLYAILAQYAEAVIGNNAKMFTATNQDPNLLNPYVLTPQQRQPIIEAWVITLLDKLKDKNIIVEKDGAISADAHLAKSIMTVNNKDFKRQDLIDIMPLFDIILTPKLKPMPAPGSVAPQPTIVNPPVVTTPQVDIPQPVQNPRQSITVPPAEDPRPNTTIGGNPSAADNDTVAPTLTPADPNKKQ